SLPGPGRLRPRLSCVPSRHEEARDDGGRDDEGRRDGARDDGRHDEGGDGAGRSGGEGRRARSRGASPGPGIRVSPIAYARIRHPQYAGFILILTGFLLQWPTLVTLAMFPVLVVMYVRLAHREETQALSEFGSAYAAYA